MRKHGVLHRDAIRSLYEACGRRGDILGKMIEKRLNLKEDDPKFLAPENFSFKQIAEAMGGDTSPAGEMIFDEAVTAAQFQTLVGTLLSKKVMDAYNEFKGVADKLVTKFTSNLESDTIPGAYRKGDMQNVGENAEYPHLGDVDEKYVTISHQKRGLILDVTEEAIRFDRTGLVMREATRLGDTMARDREVRLIKGIQDLTSYKSWYPSGTQTDLYQNAQGAGDEHEYDNLVTDVLADYTDIEALWLLLRLMKDDEGRPLDIRPTQLLVPVTLEITATKIINNEVLSGATNDERNPVANWFTIIATPDLDDNSTTAWYLGDFKKQFLEKVIIAPSVMTRRASDKNDQAWNRDVVASYKARYDTQLGATDYRYVGKSTGAG
jgi:hypothetical protein